MQELAVVASVVQELAVVASVVQQIAVVEAEASDCRQSLHVKDESTRHCVDSIHPRGCP